MNQPKRILVVEDERDLADLLVYNLGRAGYEATVVGDGRTAVESSKSNPPDLVILDVMIPRLSGLEVARELRANPQTSQLPIIMLTARAAEADQLAGLGVGADDYITKPFSTKVLLARIEALLRRTAAAGAVVESDLVRHGPIVADLATHRVTSEGRLLTLTLTEFRLLIALLRAKGRTLSRAEMMNRAMGPGVMVTARTIDVHIAAIRRKLERAGLMIRTVRGVGYRMSAEGEGVEEADGDEGDAGPTAGGAGGVGGMGPVRHADG